MADLLNDLLKKSMEREAKKMAANGGVTEKDRYGNLLDSVKNRDIDKEQLDNIYEKAARIRKNAENSKAERELEREEARRNLNRILMDVNTRDKREADAFISRNKERLDRAKATIKKEQDKLYFS
jgi:F0F1-type ATP synthase membrane subunit b/b'